MATNAVDHSFSRTPHRRGAWSLLAVVGLAGAAVLGPVTAVSAQSKDESLNDFFSVDGAGIQRLARQQQEAIASCMKQKGFEYKVVGLGEFADVVGDSLDPEKFADKYGYGVTTLINPDKVGKAAEVDANAAILAKMSAGQAKAYNKALTGSEQSKGGLLTPGGCVGESTKKLFSSLIKLQALGPKFEEIQQRVNNNPKVLAGMKKWAACMKEAGYTYRTDADPAPALQKELQALAPQTGASAPSGGLASAFGASIDTTKLDATKLRALQKKELTISKVDRDCTKKHLKDRESLQKAEEKKFIAENRAVLEDARTALGGKKK